MFTRCPKHQILYRGECPLCKSGVDAKLNGERLQDWEGNVIASGVEGVVSYQTREIGLRPGETLTGHAPQAVKEG